MPSANDLKYCGGPFSFSGSVASALSLSGCLVPFVAHGLFLVSLCFFLIRSSASATFDLEVHALLADMSKILKSILKQTYTLPEWKEVDEICRNVWLGT